jgi:hypothetical protein
MKFCILLFSTLFLTSVANAGDVNAATCNACSDAQKEQRAITAFQQNHENTQYVLDLVDGDVKKYLVHFDSTCRPIQPSEKGKTRTVVTSNASGCGSYIAADPDVVEPEFQVKGNALSTIFLFYGTTAAKVNINVADLAPAGSNPHIADMDAFDYTNISSDRNSLNELLIRSIRDDTIGNLNPTIREALANLLKPLDRLFADGKLLQLDVTFKFADGSEITIRVVDDHTFEKVQDAQDANNNDVAENASAADGQTYRFDIAPTDQNDWLSYMRSLGVRITNNSSGGAHSYSCYAEHQADGTTIVRCHLN